MTEHRRDLIVESRFPQGGNYCSRVFFLFLFFKILMSSSFGYFVINITLLA